MRCDERETKRWRMKKADLQECLRNLVEKNKTFLVRRSRVLWLDKSRWWLRLENVRQRESQDPRTAPKVKRCKLWMFM